MPNDIYIYVGGRGWGAVGVTAFSRLFPLFQVDRKSMADGNWGTRRIRCRTRRLTCEPSEARTHSVRI